MQSIPAKQNFSVKDQQTMDRPLSSKLSCDPKYIMEKAKEEEKNIEMGVDVKLDLKSNLLKALSLNEFNSGMFATLAVGEMYKTLVIDLMQKYQVEYKCIEPSEQALCELAAINYIRILEIQTKLHSKYLDIPIVNEFAKR
jgi:hypothetical protein